MEQREIAGKARDLLASYTICWRSFPSVFFVRGHGTEGLLNTAPLKVVMVVMGEVAKIMESNA